MAKDTREYSVAGLFPQVDLFMRTRPQPVSIDVYREAWRIVQTVIDYGNYIIRGFGLSDWRGIVIAALLRRILITAESVRLLASKGLMEPAFATMRTLVELEMILRLVIKDSSDRTARRYATFQAVMGRRHFRKATGEASFRESMKADSAHWTWLRNKSRSFKEWIDSEANDDIREEISRSEHWHGFKNQKEAFEAAEMLTDYYQIYDGASVLVHGGGVEHDLSDAEDGEIILAPLIDPDPGANFHNVVGLLSFSLVKLYQLLLEEGGGRLEEDPEPIVLTGEDGAAIHLSSLEGLMALVLGVFQSRQMAHQPERSNS